MIAAATLALAAACGSSAEGCEEDGRSYDDGDTWTCGDGCNTCGCNEGMVSRTAVHCGSPPGPAAGKLVCREGGTQHRHGDTWTCDDGCSACTCADGAVSRDEAPCAGGDAG